MPKGLHLLIAAQFASALADNALLIVTIALLQAQGAPLWWAPLLKLGFTLAYVLLAPFVGPVADTFPKARLMAWMNGVKLVGTLALLMGLQPVLAYAIVGLGAATYAPAKYGLVTELVKPQGLVKANGWLEVTVVCAALLGAALGGVLVSPWLLALLPQELGLRGPVLLLIGVYLLAGLLNLGIPDSGARYPAASRQPVQLAREFWRDHLKLWRDVDGGLSLAVTTLFWGAAATLQFAVLRWAADVFDLPLGRAAGLQAVVALGVMLGAAAAGRWVPLHAAKRMLGLGVLLGLIMLAAASTESLVPAIALLALVGAVGGLLVVPLNALLQHRGCVLLSAGRSIAVQGFNENASVLVMLALYTALLALEVPIVQLIRGLGLCVAGAIALLMWREKRRLLRQQPACAPT